MIEVNHNILKKKQRISVVSKYFVCYKVFCLCACMSSYNENTKRNIEDRYDYKKCIILVYFTIAWIMWWKCQNDIVFINLKVEAIK